MIRLLAGAATTLALLVASPSPVAAGVATTPIAPSSMVAEVSYGNYTGYLSAHHTGTTKGSARVCLILMTDSVEDRAGRQFDVLDGCTKTKSRAQYSFDPLRWKGVLAVDLPLERRQVRENSDTTSQHTGHAAAGIARVDLRFSGTGTPEFVVLQSTLCLLCFGASAQKDARANGTLTIDGKPLAINGASGRLWMGV